jgi:hypothetical protein
MADSAGKTAEDKIPFNFFKKLPKIVSILKIFSSGIVYHFEKSEEKIFHGGDGMMFPFPFKLFSFAFQFARLFNFHYLISGTSCSYQRIYKRRDD